MVNMFMTQIFILPTRVAIALITSLFTERNKPRLPFSFYGLFAEPKYVEPCVRYWVSLRIVIEQIATILEISFLDCFVEYGYGEPL